MHRVDQRNTEPYGSVYTPGRRRMQARQVSAAEPGEEGPRRPRTLGSRSQAEGSVERRGGTRSTAGCELGDWMSAPAFAATLLGAGPPTGEESAIVVGDDSPIVCCRDRVA